MAEAERKFPNRRYAAAFLRGWDEGWAARQRKLEEPLTPEEEERLLAEVDLELALEAAAERLRDERV